MLRTKMKKYITTIVSNQVVIRLIEKLYRRKIFKVSLSLSISVSLWAKNSGKTPYAARFRCVARPGRKHELAPINRRPVNPEIHQDVSAWPGAADEREKLLDQSTTLLTNRTFWKQMKISLCPLSKFYSPSRFHRTNFIWENLDLHEK